jgi:hypothetical protein
MRRQRGPSCRTLLLSSLVAAAAHAGSVSIALPERSACDFEQVAAALRSRLPDAQLEQGRTRDPAAVQISLERSGDEWAIAILAPGQLPLRRPLSALGSDCVALSEAAALIAERYLESIQWTTGPVEVDRLPPPEPSPSWQLSVALGGGATPGLTGVAPMGELDVGARWGAWLIEASALYLGSGQIALVTTTNPAYEYQYSAAAQLAFGRRFGFGRSAVRVQLTPGAELLWVGSLPSAPNPSPNPLPHHQVAFAAVPFVGLRAGYEFSLSDRLSLGLRVQARVALAQHSFLVEGYTQSLVTHLVDGDAQLALSYLFF